MKNKLTIYFLSFLLAISPVAGFAYVESSNELKSYNSLDNHIRSDSFDLQGINEKTELINTVRDIASTANSMYQQSKAEKEKAETY